MATAEHEDSPMRVRSGRPLSSARLSGWLPIVAGAVVVLVVWQRDRSRSATTRSSSCPPPRRCSRGSYARGRTACIEPHASRP